MTTATFTPDRETFRTTLAQVAAQARAILPEQVNGRIESAVRLVLSGDVVPQADGTITVYSATDATRRYVLQGSACTCTDFTSGKAPESWCKHRISANLLRSVERVLARTAAPTPVQEPPVEPWPDNDPEPEPEPPAPVRQPPGQPAPAALPEARCSVNCHVTISGRQVQVTLRGHDEGEVLARLEAVLQRYPLPQTPAQPPSQPRSPQQMNAAAMPQAVDFCKVHNVPMKLNEKEGRQWRSHWSDDEQRWCKGR